MKLFYLNITREFWHITSDWAFLFEASVVAVSITSLINFVVSLMSSSSSLKASFLCSSVPVIRFFSCSSMLLVWYDVDIQSVVNEYHQQRRLSSLRSSPLQLKLYFRSKNLMRELIAELFLIKLTSRKYLITLSKIHIMECIRKLFNMYTKGLVTDACVVYDLSDTNALDNFRLNYLFYYLSFSLVFFSLWSPAWY